MGSTLSAAAFHATPLARSPRPALVHTSGKPTAARFAPPAPRVVMTFGDTVSELFGGIAAVLAVVAITQDDGDAVESQRATEASAEATDSPALGSRADTDVRILKNQVRAVDGIHLGLEEGNGLVFWFGRLCGRRCRSGQDRSQ